MKIGTRAFFLLFVCLPISAVAQEATATLSQPATRVGQPVQLEIKVTGARSADVPEQIAVDGLEIFPSGQSSQFEMRNFDITTSVVHTYTIVPLREGSFTIPSLAIGAGGSTLRTRPLTLHVSASGRGVAPPSTGRRAAPPASADTRSAVAFAEIVLAKNLAYVGESIPAEVRFYFDASTRVRADEMPTLQSEGFILQKLSEPRQEQLQHEGNVYNVVSYQTAVTPVKFGELTLGPASMKATVQRPRARRPRLGFQDFEEFFDDAFSHFTINEPITVQSEEQTVEVKPLPPGAPKTFAGAVGRFELSAEASPTELKVGDPITLTAKVTGRGDFGRVNAPSLSEEQGWRSYPPSSRFDQDDPLGLSGTKSFEMALIPNEKKEAVPPLVFSFFNPETEKYETLRTAPIPLKVEGQRIAAATPSPAVAASPATPAQERAPAADILHIRTGPAKWAETFEPLYEKREFWLAQLVPLLALLGFAGVKIYRARQGDYAARQKAALRREKHDLMKRIRSASNDQELYDSAMRYLQIDTALATGKSPAAVDAADACAAHARDSETEGRVREIFEKAAALKFSGVPTSETAVGTDERAEVLATVKELERSAGG